MLGDNFTHANFSVDDLGVAKDFYVNKLGFNIKREADYGITLESGKGTRILIYYKPDHVAWNSTVLGIEVEDVREEVKNLKARGVNMEKLDGTDEDGVMTDPNIGAVAWFKDPAKNWICISSTN